MTDATTAARAAIRTEPVSYGEAFKAFFPHGAPKANETPLATAWQWWHAVLAGRTKQVATLCATPADWADLDAVAEDLSQFALVQTIVPSDERPDRVAYAQFIPHTAKPVRIAAGSVATNGRWLTLVRRGDLWYVWGLSDITYRPEAGRIYSDARIPKKARRTPESHKGKG